MSAENKPSKCYYGLTEGPFKTRYNAHKRSFRTESCRRDTELSKHIWDLKDNDVQYNIEWKIEHLASPYRCGTRICDVCLTEKMVIATADSTSMLNKRSEIISACRHRTKFKYENVPD